MGFENKVGYNVYYRASVPVIVVLLCVFTLVGTLNNAELKPTQRACFVAHDGSLKNNSDKNTKVIAACGELMATSLLEAQLDISQIIDISWPLQKNMTTYKNRVDFTHEQVKNWDADQVRESRIYLSTHVGTHIDAPAHFLEKGKMIEQVLLSTLLGPCQVLDLTYIEEGKGITRADLEKVILTEKRVLLKTRNSFFTNTAPFNPHFIYLEKSGAEYLAEKNIVCVGIDYLGIERQQPQHETHVLLLSKECAIIEGLRLKEVAAGVYTLICLPLAIEGVEAAPARALLIPA